MPNLEIRRYLAKGQSVGWNATTSGKVARLETVDGRLVAQDNCAGRMERVGAGRGPS
jgi:hypothetical protein